MVFVLAAMASAAPALLPNRPAYVPNEMLVRFAPNTTETERDTIASSLGGVIARPMSLADSYVVQLSPGRGVTIDTAVTRARQTDRILLAEPNYLRYPLDVVPNDPMWDRLWGLRMINCPKAWETTRGSSSVIVAVNDSGFSKTHPDLEGRLLQGYDFGDNDNDVSPDPVVEAEGSHGTHVAGIVGAQGGNGIGVVGVCWDNVKILPVKLARTGLPGMATDAAVAGLQYALDQGAQVVNMSYGTYWASEFEHSKIRQVTSAGLICVAAAGNDYGSPVMYPAAFEECIAVSALGPTEAIASYSNYGPEIDIAAPGGDGFQDSPDTIWSTVWSSEGNGYSGNVGTSMAAPHVTGAIGLILSAGVPRDRVVDQLYRGARPPKSGVLDPIKYGHGVLDVAASLNTDPAIEIISPGDGEILDTNTPVFKINTFLLDVTDIRIYLDYADANRDGIPDDLTQNLVFDGRNLAADPNARWDGATSTLTLIWPPLGMSPLAPGTHTLCAMALPSGQADAVPVKDWMVFFIQPHVLTGGRHLFSVPYALPAGTTPYDLFRTSNFTLARFIPERSSYAKINYPGEANDMLAWNGEGVHPEGENINTPPAGLGFWVETFIDMPIAIDGVEDRSRAYHITVTRGSSGWNMIGNPFPFPVPWESVKVMYRGRTLALKDAIDEGWIRPSLYRYTKNGYTFQTPPEAVLIPWEGQWVRILPNNPERANDSMVLIVPPIESGEIIETPRSRAAASDDSWRLRLQAVSGGAIDATSVVGVDSRAADGFDKLDVEKPPMLTNDVELAFVHQDWGVASGRYASDVRNSIGTGKTWNFEVSTDMPNKDITLSWPDIAVAPKKYDFVIEDADSGSRTYMRTRSSYTFNSGANAGSRRFSLYVEPASNAPLMISSITVSPTRGGTVGINYTISRDARIEVSVLDSRSKVVKRLDGNTTRAAGLNTVLWDCTAGNGEKVPGGLYLAQIVATGPDGEVVKSVRPILVR